jgi:hypothetical protein
MLTIAKATCVLPATTFFIGIVFLGGRKKGKILIWFVEQGRMHLLLTKEALTIVVLLTCLT